MTPHRFGTPVIRWSWVVRRWETRHCAHEWVPFEDWQGARMCNRCGVARWWLFGREPWGFNG
jgi:hypothetical protein